MKKCIIFSRVSSLAQEYTEQTARVRRLAEQYGYPPESHLLVEEKESGIKLSEQERLGLNRLKQLICTDNDIDCVFCFEVSRLARTKRVLYSVQEYLLQRKIQLIIAQPTLIKLLNDDGTLNPSADLMFLLFSYFSENEMKIKKERFKNGKARLAKECKYLGGGITFGYAVDPVTKKIILDDSSEIVREIFNAYSTGDWSTTTLTKELNNRGIHDKQGVPISQSRLARILSTERYTGENIYPQIISRDLFEQCKKLREEARVLRNLRKNNYASQYLCNRLIVCPECGHHFTPGSTTYRCFLHHDKPSQCSNKMQISIELIDSIAWLVASELEVGSLLTQQKDKVKEYNTELSIIEQKKKTVYDKLSKYALKVARVEDLLIEGLISKEKARTRLEKIEADNVLFEEEIKALNNDSARVSAMIDCIINTHLSIEDIEKLNDSLPEDVKKKRQIVRTHIREIKLSGWKYKNIEFFKSDLSVELKQKRYMEIEVHNKYGDTPRTWEYFPRWTYGKSKIQEITKEQ